MGGALKIAFGLPLLQIANLIAYAKTKESTAAKIATVISFVPIIILTTAIWMTVWVAVIWLAWRAVG